MNEFKWSSVYTCDFVIDVSEFVMKKTSSLKFNDMILFIITIIIGGDVVIVVVAIVAAAVAASIRYCFICYMLCFALHCIDSVCFNSLIIPWKWAELN